MRRRNDPKVGKETCMGPFARFHWKVQPLPFETGMTPIDGRSGGDMGEVVKTSSAGRVPGARLNQDLLINQTPAHQAIQDLTCLGLVGPANYLPSER